jgi:4-amino-4-deoxy-L-arabinose transferase-like glycosyltransferase
MSTYDRGRHELRMLVGLVALAFCVRLAFALVWQPPLVGDAADYQRLARGLSAGSGYVDEGGRPTAWRPPGYPFFLSLVERTAGEGRAPLAVAQAGLGAATVAVTWTVARGFGVGPALVAAALVAVDAGQVSLAARTLSEGLFTLLSLAVVALSLALVRALRSGSGAWGWATGTGLLAGAATLTRGLFVAYPAALALGLVAAAGRGGRKRAALAATVLLAAYGAALLPWTARNARAVGAPVPVATQGGFTLYASWFPPGGTGFGMLPDDAVTAGAVGLSELEQSAYFTERTVEGLTADPLRVPRLLALKIVYFWVPLDWELLPRGGIVNPTYLFVLLWACVALGVTRDRLRPTERWPIWLPLLYAFGMALVFYGSPRMRVPIEPLLAVVAAVGLVEWYRIRGRWSALRVFTGSAVAVAAVAVLAQPLKTLARTTLEGMGIWGS